MRFALGRPRSCQARATCGTRRPAAHPPAAGTARTARARARAPGTLTLGRIPHRTRGRTPQQEVHHPGGGGGGGGRPVRAGRRTRVARPAGSWRTNSGPADLQDRPHRPARSMTSARRRPAGRGGTCGVTSLPRTGVRGVGGRRWGPAAGGRARRVGRRRGRRGIGCRERGHPDWPE